MKTYGCCTYAPPLPKDSCITSEAIYPKRRQLIALQDSSSDDEVEEMVTDGERNSLGSPLSKSSSFFSIRLHDESRASAAAGLDQDPFLSGGNRTREKNAVLRKTDFFDSNDVFSTNFFSFLWSKKKDDGPFGGEAPFDTSDGNDDLESGDMNEQRQDAGLVGSHGRGGASQLRSMPKPTGGAMYLRSLDTNPNSVPDAVVQLHRDTWMMLMDNRVMAWLNRETADHCLSAAQLRQRLLNVIVQRPIAAAQLDIGAPAYKAFEKGVAGSPEEEVPYGAASITSDRGMTTSPEDALQHTLESFSPFFVVISSPNAVRKARDRFDTAKRFQLSGGGGENADLVGLPLFSQYGTWQEAYEHRTRWEKTPFSFFLIHDVSYNFGQVSALFVMLRLLYQHSHVHTRRCGELRREAATLQESSKTMSNPRAQIRIAEHQRNSCPLFALQDMAENVLLAYEQSSSRSALTMIMQVIDFLTDCALDAETAERFLSHDALVHQNTFDLDRLAAQRKGNALGGGEGNGTAKQVEGGAPGTYAAGSESDGIFKLRRAPHRVTEIDVYNLFELSYWFLDAATANAAVPIDASLLPQAAAISVTSIDADGMSLSPDALYSARSSNTSRLRTGTSRGGAQRGGWQPNQRSGTPSMRPSASPNEPSAYEKGTTRKHRYTPGKRQLYQPVESIAEAISLFDANGMQDWILQAPTSRKKNQASLEHRDTITTTTTTTNSDNGPGSPKKLVPPAVPHPASTLCTLTTPLIVLLSYIRLHGGSWMRQLCTRLFEILRKESVLLYVNKLDLEATWTALQELQLPAEIADLPDAIASAADYRRQVESAKREFLYGLSHLEDMISQDILYVINEFFSALHGKRSTTRLPQGITVALTQFVTTVHLYLLSSVGVMGNDSTAARADAAYHVVEDRLRLCKQRYLNGKRYNAGQQRHDSAAAGAGGAAGPNANASLPRLINTLEQYRLVKFILFDSWIIPGLNNAVKFGYVGSESPMHLRWNIDAFARYLKILINAPFAAEDKECFRSIRSNHSKQAAEGGGGRRTQGNRRGKNRSMGTSRGVRGDSGTPSVLALPPYITGIYDVSSGSLLRLQTLAPTAMSDLGASSQQNLGESFQSGGVSVSQMSMSPGTSMMEPKGGGRRRRKKKGMAPGMSMPSISSPGDRVFQVRDGGQLPRLGDAKGQHSSPLVNSITTTSFYTVSSPLGVGRRSESKADPFNVGSFTGPAPALFLPMDHADWMEVSGALQGLNENLGLTHYDPDEQSANFLHFPPIPGGMGGGVMGAAGQSLGDAGDNGVEASALQVLNAFCKKVSSDGNENVVVAEFDVLPSMAGGCIEKVFEVATGTHPMISSALHLGGSFPFVRKDPTVLYTACLNGVLLHPRMASRAMDSVFENNPAFYDILTQPVTDQCTLEMLSALVVGQTECPMVDVNSIIPLLQTIPNSPVPRAAAAPNTAIGRHLVSVSRRWESESRKLLQHLSFLTTGNPLDRPFSLVPVGGLSVGPVNPLRAIKAGAAAIEKDLGVVPMVFDPWWRAMVVALCVKTTNMLAECCSEYAERFRILCREKNEEAKRTYKQLAAHFIATSGKETQEAAAPSALGEDGLPLPPRRKRFSKQKASLSLNQLHAVQKKKKPKVKKQRATRSASSNKKEARK